MKHKLLIFVLLLPILLVAFNESNLPFIKQIVTEGNASSIIIETDNLVMKENMNGEKEIFYQAPRPSYLERDCLLHLSFDISPSNVIIHSIENTFMTDDLTVLSATEVEISLPTNEYAVIVYFNDNPDMKINVLNNVSVTGENQELQINSTDADNLIQLSSSTVDGNSFNTTDNYYSLFSIYIPDKNFIYHIHAEERSYIYISNLNDLVLLYCAEQNVTENQIYLTEFGPYTEINDDLIITNTPQDYHQKAISVEIPETIEDPHLGVFNGIFVPISNTFGYFSMINNDDFLPVDFGIWHGQLFMMNNENISNPKFRIYSYITLASDNDLMTSYATFQYDEGSIGSHWNLVPIETDYVPNDNQIIELSPSPQNIYSNFYYSGENEFYVLMNLKGYKKESYESSIMQTVIKFYDENNNLISAGNPQEIYGMTLQPDRYTITFENYDYYLKGIQGKSISIVNIDLEYEDYIPPHVMGFQTRNSENVITDSLEVNQSGSFLCNVSDYFWQENEVVYKPVPEDSIHVFYKNHYYENWEELDFEIINEYQGENYVSGKIISANLSALTVVDSVAYDIKVSATDEDGFSVENIVAPAFVVGSFDVTSTSTETIQPQKQFITNYPNPFNPTTTIKFSLPQNSLTEIAIYNIKGQKVKNLLNQEMEKGNHQIQWNGTDEAERKVSSGVYFYQLQVNGEDKAVGKMLMVK